MKPSHLVFSILVLSPLHPLLAPAPPTSAEPSSPAAAAPIAAVPVAAPASIPVLPPSAVVAVPAAAAAPAAQPAPESRPGSGLFDGSREETPAPKPARVVITPGRRIGNPQRQFERELGL